MHSAALAGQAPAWPEMGYAVLLRPASPFSPYRSRSSTASAAQLTALIGSARSSLAVENEEMSSSAVVDALEAAARRELLEETGYEASEMKYVGGGPASALVP